MHKHSIRIVSLILLLAMLLTACGTAGASKEPPAEKAEHNDGNVVTETPTVVKVATSESIVKCDPHDQQGIPGRAGVMMVMETLLETDHEGNYTGLLADSWEISDGGLVITMFLKDGIIASNGEVFNADDVVCTFNRILESDTINARVATWTKLESVEKVDDLTVNFYFTEPEAMALNYFSSTVCFTDEAYAQYGEKLWEDQIMIGTGPWCWGEWVDGQYLHLTKNENYWNKDEYDPAYKEFYMYFLTEESSAIAAHLAGDVDAYLPVGGITADSQSLYDNYEDIELLTVKTSLFHFMGFQCAEGKIFNNPDLRRAFSMAIDRELIGTSFLGDSIEVAKGGVAFSFTLGYDENLDSPYYEYNPEAAKALVESTDYNDEEINLLIGSNVPSGESIGLVIAEECQKVGLNVVVEMAEIATFQDRRKGGAYDCYITTDGIGYGECYTYMNTRIRVDIHKSNYVNEEFNNLVKQAGVTVDTAARDEIYKQCNAILAQDVPHLSLFCQPSSYAINKDVGGIQIYSDSYWFTHRIDYAG